MEKAIRRALDFLTSPAKGPPGGGSIVVPHCMFQICQRDPEVRRGHRTNILARTIDLAHVDIFFEQQILAFILFYLFYL